MLEWAISNIPQYQYDHPPLIITMKVTRQQIPSKSFPPGSQFCWTEAADQAWDFNIRPLAHPSTQYTDDGDAGDDDHADLLNQDFLAQTQFNFGQICSTKCSTICRSSHIICKNTTDQKQLDCGFSVCAYNLQCFEKCQLHFLQT